MKVEADSTDVILESQAGIKIDILQISLKTSMTGKAHEFDTDGVSVADMSSEDVDAYLNSLETQQETAGASSGQSQEVADHPTEKATQSEKKPDGNIDQQASADPMDQELSALESLLTEVQNQQEEPSAETRESGEQRTAVTESASKDNQIPDMAYEQAEEIEDTLQPEAPVIEEEEVGQAEDKSAGGNELKEEADADAPPAAETADSQPLREEKSDLADAELDEQVEAASDAEPSAVRKSVFKGSLDFISTFTSGCLSCFAQLLMLLDRPFSKLSLQTKAVLGYMAWATLIMAAATWIVGRMIHF